MNNTSSFWLPGRASTLSGEVDSLFYFILFLSLFFFVLIVSGMIVFIIRFRRRKEDEDRKITGPTHNVLLEASWIIIPLILVFIIFARGFHGFLKMSIVPRYAMEVKVTAQKWFWSFHYPEGANTVNELVVPVGKPVKLLLSSQDVIHSFFVPSFRLKRDVLPNRYAITWFEATDVGDYDLFCAEYCGTKHSGMVGKIRVLPEAEYEKWLEESSFAGEGMTPADYGAKLYVSRACITCHTVDGGEGDGPTFLNAFGRLETLTDGSTVTVDENYIRESVLEPMTKVVAGYQPIMPTYQGLLKDREIDALVEYIKSLADTNEN